jgi:hypothetical protein
MSITFKEILNQKVWNNYEDYVTQGIEEYSQSLSKELEIGRKMNSKIRAFVEKNFEIKKIPNNLSRAEQLLTEGSVIGIDGTLAKHRTVTGLMAQIGIIAVNYKNEKLQHSYFISEANYKEDIEEVTEYLFSHEPDNQIISDLVIRAVLFYREREIGLKEEYDKLFKLYHGPLIPHFEMLGGLGKLRALDTTIEVLEKIIRNKKCISIISRSINNAYIRLGFSLNKGEYFKLKHTNIGKEIRKNERFMNPEKWRINDFDKVTGFLDDQASRVDIGIIKISERPYVFHAHKENFDIAAEIIARDSMFQHEKGFPLLIDYADTLCSNYYKASDFYKILEYKLAKEGEFLSEMSEETLRQK